MYKSVWEVLRKLTRFLEFPVLPQCYLNIFLYFIFKLYYLNIFDHTALSIKKEKRNRK